MSTLAKLKLVAAKRPNQLSPVVQRRNKVAKHLFDQIECAKARQDGKSYMPTWSKSVKDEETGETKTVLVPKRMREWWFVADSGKTCVSLRYGAKIVEIAKGKTAVELASAADLVPTLETLKAAVEIGELDAQIEAVSGLVRAGFKKS